MDDSKAFSPQQQPGRVGEKSPAVAQDRMSETSSQDAKEREVQDAIISSDPINPHDLSILQLSQLLDNYNGHDEHIEEVFESLALLFDRNLCITITPRATGYHDSTILNKPTMGGLAVAKKKARDAEMDLEKAHAHAKFLLTELPRLRKLARDARGDADQYEQAWNAYCQQKDQDFRERVVARQLAVREKEKRQVEKRQVKKRRMANYLTDKSLL